MNRDDRSSEGWYYKQNGKTFGPLSTRQLEELLAAGRLQARQAVWKFGSQHVLFVPAAAAALEDRRMQPVVSAAEPGSASLP
jgi:hypothetical protein